MARIPGLTTPRWYQREWLFELVVATGVACALIWAAIDAFTADQPGKGWVLAASVVAFAAAVWKVQRARDRDRIQMRAESPTDLLGCAYVLHKALCRHLEAESSQIRATIHRVLTEPARGRKDEEEYFEQVIPYVGGDGDGPGRRWSTSVGIVGRVAREGCPLWALRQGQGKQQFVDELVREWHYSKKAAKKLSDDRKGWIAVPIFDEAPTVIGVVYVDSVIESHVNEEICGQLVDLTEAVASFIRKRYK